MIKEFMIQINNILEEKFNLRAYSSGDEVDRINSKHDTHISYTNMNDKYPLGVGSDFTILISEDKDSYHKYKVTCSCNSHIMDVEVRSIKHSSYDITMSIQIKEVASLEHAIDYCVDSMDKLIKLDQKNKEC